ncbi:MAG: 3-hydroxyacyl-CoA dehydrogenase NAD-binding domain-containing protein, partial [Gammaproteobacteria bacterium]
MSYQNWRVETDDSDIAWLGIDLADASTNVLSRPLLDELEQILSTLEESPPAGVVFISAKPSGFIAGADISEFKEIQGREVALKMIHRGQEIMNRIDALRCPTVAVLNGFCMGGGTELALACDYRIALDESRTRIGLPEIKLGLHPGYGGTVRSVRVVGSPSAMDLMLTGRSLDVRRAKKMGLIDYAVPGRQLENTARHVIAHKPRQHRPRRLVKSLRHWSMRPLVAWQMRKKVSARAKRAHYPAPYALIDLWQQHADSDAGMMREEANSLANLATTSTARNLLRVFSLQDRLKALGKKDLFAPKHVHVVGGGLMGGDIAAWCAVQGLNVTVQDTNPEALGSAMQRASKLFKRRLKDKRLISNTLDRLIPDADGYGVKHADVVVEAIVENAEAKQGLYRALEPQMKTEAVLATNTSSIPLEVLSQSLDDPGRLVGLHFFNPVALMPLVEIVRGAQSHEDTLVRAAAFTRHIDKLPLPVKSSPGFLVNRILMPYLLEAVILANEGIPKGAIDKAATDFGMPMGPIELADTVGLDVGLFVGEILGKEFGFDIPQKLRDLVAAKKLGKKTGEGFYVWKDGKAVREKEKFAGNTGNIQSRLILRLVNEAVACLREGVVEDADLVDAGVIFGTGFAPFTGGPLEYREKQGREAMEQELRQLEARHG